MDDVVVRYGTEQVAWTHGVLVGNGKYVKLVKKAAKKKQGVTVGGVKFTGGDGTPLEIWAAMMSIEGAVLVRAGTSVQGLEAARAKGL